MNFVEPIRDIGKVNDICNYLKKTSTRNYIMFLFGIYVGLRISDILDLRVKDVKNKKTLTLKEKKTKKYKNIEIHPKLRTELKSYCSGKGSNDFLFQSREGRNEPLGRVRAYQILKEAGEIYGLCNLGTHTMRKTFGYHFYKKTNDVVTLQKIFNHSHPSITLKYIGIEQDAINQAIRNISYD